MVIPLLGPGESARARTEFSEKVKIGVSDHHYHGDRLYTGTQDPIWRGASRRLKRGDSPKTPRPPRCGHPPPDWASPPDWVWGSQYPKIEKMCDVTKRVRVSHIRVIMVFGVRIAISVHHF